MEKIMLIYFDAYADMHMHRYILVIQIDACLILVDSLVIGVFAPNVQ